ncbi:MAG: glycosyltransferase family 9 protein [Planctomycetota bacterium]|nr:glycosyltransferase family 9 protein [Planctomycetota bacterium]
MAKRILIVRLSAIGDCILSVPVLNALRRNFPNAKIGWVIERAASQLILGHKALDEMFVVSKKTFKSPSQLLAFGKTIRAWKPDITLDLQGLTKSSLIAWMSGAKDRLGFHRDQFDGREVSCILNNRLYRPESKHIVDRSLELLKLLGVDDSEVSFELPESDSNAAFAERTMRTLHMEGRFAMINVGAGWASKLWPADRYARVARHLGEQLGLPSLVVWSGDQERTIAEHVVLESSNHASLAPPTTLAQLSSLIRLASLFVGSDTGPMHLSAALGTPTIGMIGPMPIERVSPYGASHVGVQNIPLLNPANRKKDCGPMLSIFTEHVTQACDQLISRNILKQAS